MLLNDFGLTKKKVVFSVLKSLSLVGQVFLEPEESTVWVGEELGLAGATSQIQFVCTFTVSATIFG